MADQERDERFALNESRFREINDRVKADLAHLRSRSDPVGFVCECASLECRKQIPMTYEQYEDLRSDAMQFGVAPGHELPDTEDVVQRHERFVVVRKHENTRHVVEATDPRSRRP